MTKPLTEVEVVKKMAKVANADVALAHRRNHKPRTSGFEFDDKLLALAKTGSPASV